MIEKKMHSNHYLGAEITYRIVDTNIGKYRFKVTLYRECSGASFTNEKLIVRSAQYDVLLPLNFIYKEEITALCQVPDVSTNPTTRCSDSLASSLVRGIERWVYEIDYTVGKNIGWAYAAWTACCRNEVTTCITGSVPIWVQTGFNTNYPNNSIVGSATPIPNWNKLRTCSYNMGAIDSFDPKNILIQNKFVTYDSIAYELYTPMIGGPANANVGYSTNPTVIFNSPLNRFNFIYTTSGISFNPKTGTISTIPTMNQEAILALAVREYRAVPDSSSQGYKRVLVGYYTRDIQFSVGDIVPAIVQAGLQSDSSKIIQKSSNNSIYKTCRLKNNRLQFKFISPNTQGLKLKDISSIDTSMVENYSFQKYIKSGTNQDSLYLNIRFDFKQASASYKFMYQLYYCTALGHRVEEIIPIEVALVEDTLRFEQDTIYYCHGEPTLKLSIPGAELLRWNSNIPIINAESIDSSWVEILPSHSGWFYVSNAHTSSKCPANDSIYIQVDTCQELSGVVFLDSINNCTWNHSELKFPNELIKISQKNSGYKVSINTNDTGFYSIRLPQNRDYILSIPERYLNCSSIPTLYTSYLSATSFLLDLPVKDTLHISSITVKAFDTLVCAGDSLKYDVSFQKSYGNCQVMVLFSDGDTTRITFPLSEGVYSISGGHKYNQSGIHITKINWLNAAAKCIDSLVYKPKMVSCLKGYTIFDINKNCTQDSSDRTIENVLITYADLNTGKLTHLFTNRDGYYILPFDRTHKHSIKSNEKILCGNSPNTILLDSFQKDTTIMRNIYLNLDSLNYKINIIPRGRIDLWYSLYLNIEAKALVEDIGLLKSFSLTLPPKSRFISIKNHANYSVNGSNIIVSAYKDFTIELKFDSLVSKDTMCFNVSLDKVLKEENLYDNLTTLCLPSFTAYDPNNKFSMIHSMGSDGSFADKSYPILYTINFQNTGSAPARDVQILDTLDKLLDISSLSIIGSSHRMSASIDENRLLRFTFPNINLPDSISNEPASHGYISFSIKPIANLELNQTISNKVGIYFDFNEAIFTNRVMNQYKLKDTSRETTGIVLSKIEGVMYVYPNPASDFLFVTSSETRSLPSAVIPTPSTAPLSFGEAGRGITLTNLLGQSFSPPVIPANLLGSQHHHTGISLDIHSLPEGIYLLQIRDKNDNLIKTERIVIQRDQ